MPAKNAYRERHGFGTWLGDFLESRRETQEELAAKLSYSRSTISNLIKGYRQPSSAFLKTFGECFPEQNNAAQTEAMRHRSPIPSPDDAAWRVTQATITSHIASGKLGAAQTTVYNARKRTRNRAEGYWLDLHEAEIARLQNNSMRHFVALGYACESAERLGLPVAQLASVYDKQICAALWIGGPELAEAMTEDLLRKSPNLALLWYRKAALQWGKGHFAGAYSALTSASKAPSRNLIRTDIQCLRGLVLVGLERYPEALDDLDRALNNVRKLPIEYLCAESTRLYLAFELKTISSDKVLPAFTRLEQTNPENAWIFLYRSLCRLKMGDPTSAFVDMDRVPMCDKPSVCSWAVRKIRDARAPYDLATALGATEKAKV